MKCNIFSCKTFGHYASNCSEENSNQKMSSNKQNRFGKKSKPNKTVKFVDTSSENTEEFGVHAVFTESLYEKYWSHSMLSQSQCKLNSYSGQSILYKGLLTVNVRHDSKTHQLSAFNVCGNRIIIDLRSSIS